MRRTSTDQQTEEGTSPLAARLRARRLELLREDQNHWTLRAMGRRLDVSHALLSQVEAGRNPSDRLIALLAQDLGLEADELHALAGSVPPDVRDAVAANRHLFHLVRSLKNADARRIDTALRAVRDGDW